MIRTVSIVPSILTDNKQDYRTQVEKINVFTRRVQIDVTEEGEPEDVSARIAAAIRTYCEK